MKIKLTFNITVTQEFDTEDAGYIDPRSIESCVTEEQSWYGEGSQL